MWFTLLFLSLKDVKNLDGKIIKAMLSGQWSKPQMVLGIRGSVMKDVRSFNTLFIRNRIRTQRELAPDWLDLPVPSDACAVWCRMSISPFTRDDVTSSWAHHNVMSSTRYITKLDKIFAEVILHEIALNSPLRPIMQWSCNCVRSNKTRRPCNVLSLQTHMQTKITRKIPMIMIFQ